MYIKINNLTKSFKLFKRSAGLKGALKSFLNREYQTFTALDNISLEINKGEIIGILGENGAGKTTLIKLMVGLLYPNKGNVIIDGYNPWERNYKFLSNISVVMGQKNQLWWDIPASESFLLNKHIYNLNDKEYHETLDELVNYLDVKEKLNVQVRRLSLGERMKMEIIAALLHNPKIVLLDEPTIGLDVISQARIRDFIKYYNETKNTTFLLTSHYMNDIKALCDRVYVIHKGNSLYDGNFDKLVEKVNPKRKLIFEFSTIPSKDKIKKLLDIYKFKINDSIVKAELPDQELTKLVSELFLLDYPASLTLEDLPVEETMRAFFSNPEKFI